MKDSLVNAAFEDAIVHNPAFANWDKLDDDERKAKERVLKNYLWQELSRIQIQTGTAKGPMTEEEADYTYHYCVGGALGVIESWAMGGYRVEVAVLGDMLSGLIENGRIRNIRRY